MMPNLFHYATKELSQDAFICWLLAWADKSHAADTTGMHQAGLLLLNAMLKKHNKPCVSLPNIEIKRQEKHIDILAIVDGHWVLLIEDKTNSREHGDQLERYLKQALEDPKLKGYKLLPIFAKTGDQSDYRSARKHGYQLFLREDFLEALGAANTKNPIFTDFLSHLKARDERTRGYQTRTIEAWGVDEWTGFFIDLQKDILSINWGYVPNKGGGFMGCWWGFQQWQGKNVYLQLQQDRLCFKISSSQSTENPREKVNTATAKEWYSYLNSNNKHSGLKSLIRAKRIASATTITVAYLDGAHWMMRKPDGLLDLVKTLENLRAAEKLVSDTLCSLA